MQLVRFMLVGILNTVIGLSCIFGAMRWLGMDYRVANAIGFAIGCLVGFLLNRSWTFRHEGTWWSSLARWLSVVGISYLCNLLVVISLHGGLGIGVYAAQFGGMFVYTVASFLGGRYFAFRPDARDEIVANA